MDQKEAFSRNTWGMHSEKNFIETHSLPDYLGYVLQGLGR